MKEAIKRFMIKNRLNYKDYMIVYVVAYAITGGILKQVIYSPIHLHLIVNVIIFLPVRVIYRENILASYEARGIGIRIFISHMPIIIAIWVIRTILNRYGISTELIFGW